MQNLVSQYARDLAAALTKGAHQTPATDEDGSQPVRYYAGTVSPAVRAKRRARNKRARAARRIARKAAA